MSNELPAETKMTAEEMADALLKDAVITMARGGALDSGKVVGSVSAPGQQFGPPEDAIAILRKKGYTVEFETFANDGTVYFLFDFLCGVRDKDVGSSNKKRKDVPADAEVDEKQTNPTELAKIPRFLRADYASVKKIIDDKAAAKKKQAVELAAKLASAAVEAVKTAPGETTFETKCDCDNPHEIETLLWQRGWSVSTAYRLGECVFKFDFAVPPFSI